MLFKNWHLADPSLAFLFKDHSKWTTDPWSHSLPHFFPFAILVEFLAVIITLHPGLLGCYHSPIHTIGRLWPALGKEGQCLILPHTLYKVQHTALSKCSLRDRQGRPTFAYHKKMVPRRDSQGKVVNWKRLRGPNKNTTGSHLFSNAPRPDVFWNSKLLTF